jgi:hypothetical protein
MSLPERNARLSPPWIALLMLAMAAASCGTDDASSSAGGDEPTPDAGAEADVPGEEDTATDTGPVEPSRPLVLVVDELPVELGPNGSNPVTFEVPEGVVSLAVVVEGDPGTSYVLSEWTQAQGGPLVEGNWQTTDQNFPALCSVCTNRVVGSESVFAALAPNNERPDVAAGTHTVRIYGYEVQGFQVAPAAGSTVRLTVWAKVLPVPPMDGVIDFHLHFTGAGWTAESAQGDVAFQTYLDDVRDIYEQVGLEIGRVTYRDIDPSFRVIEGFQGAGNDLEALFSLSQGNDEGDVNVFFVGELRQGGPLGNFGVVLGIAGGIPGPPLLQGSARSGVAVAVDSHTSSQLPAPGDIANTWAHEVGHFLGLSHTSEQALFGPQLHDPIADTPENDDSWLMHNSAAGRNLSRTQGMVMRANPWIRH